MSGHLLTFTTTGHKTVSNSTITGVDGIVALSDAMATSDEAAILQVPHMNTLHQRERKEVTCCASEDTCSTT